MDQIPICLLHHLAKSLSAFNYTKRELFISIISSIFLGVFTYYVGYINSKYGKKQDES